MQVKIWFTKLMKATIYVCIMDRIVSKYCDRKRFFHSIFSANDTKRVETVLV
jgi:hypothetical protein